jgi:hypothetical protein
MTEHILKCWPTYWDAVQRGDKRFEIRRDDRGFQRGDTLVLRKTEHLSPYNFAIKTREGWNYEFYDLRRTITYVLTGGQLGIEPGYVILGLSDSIGVQGK